MTQAPFGNDPAKIARYRAFWNRDDVRRPLVGFSFVGWFPLQEFTACKTWGSADYLTPDMVDPGAFIEDHIRMLRKGEKTDDDLLRGACPGQVAVPWLPGMLGCRLRILPQNVMGEERHLPWDARESLMGFCGMDIPVCRAPIEGRECECYVVPGVGSLREEFARRLSAFNRGGGCGVFESAAGFGEFEDQRNMLARHFGIRIQTPVDLWANGAAPYIDYRWPVCERVRDFSRVTPIFAEGLKIIGYAGDLPVAARRGRFIFLGSPVGPALLAGDHEAHSWFSALAGWPA